MSSSEASDPFEATRALAHAYLNATTGKDEAALRRCLAERIEFDGGGGRRLHDPDEFARRCCAGTPWSNATLLDMLVADGHVALFHEADDVERGQRVRVAEFISVRGSKIYGIRSTYTIWPLPGHSNGAQSKDTQSQNFGFRR